MMGSKSWSEDKTNNVYSFREILREGLDAESYHETNCTELTKGKDGIAAEAEESMGT